VSALHKCLLEIPVILARGTAVVLDEVVDDFRGILLPGWVDVQDEKNLHTQLDFLPRSICIPGMYGTQVV
jgi:hypothetical protein